MQILMRFLFLSFFRDCQKNIFKSVSAYQEYYTFTSRGGSVVSAWTLPLSKTFHTQRHTWVATSTLTIGDNSAEARLVFANRPTIQPCTCALCLVGGLARSRGKPHLNMRCNIVTKRYLTVCPAEPRRLEALGQTINQKTMSPLAALQLASEVVTFAHSRGTRPCPFVS